MNINHFPRQPLIDTVVLDHLRRQPLDAGDAAAVLDVVDHRLAVEVVDGSLPVDTAAQEQRVDVGSEVVGFINHCSC